MLSGRHKIFSRPIQTAITSTFIPSSPVPSQLRIPETGLLYTWGCGRSAKTGHSVFSDFQLPKKLDLPAPVTGLCAGIFHSIALLQNGAVYCWGSNFYGQCGHIADFSFLDDADEIMSPQKVIFPSSGKGVKVASSNFSSSILTDNQLFSFGGGCLGRGDEFCDSNPLPVAYFSTIHRKVLDVEMGGDMTVVLCCKNGNSEQSEVYLHGYVQSKTGKLFKALAPCLVKHSLTLNPRLVAVSKGNGSYSGSGTFAVIGKKLVTPTCSETLQIYGKKQEAPPRSTPDGDLGFIQRMISRRTRRLEAENQRIDSMRRDDNLPPDYPFMRGDAEVLEYIYQDEPIVSIELTVCVKQIVMGEGTALPANSKEFCCILSEDGVVYTTSLATDGESKLHKIEGLDGYTIDAMAVAGGSGGQSLMVLATGEGQCVMKLERTQDRFRDASVVVRTDGCKVKGLYAGFDHFAIHS